MPICKQFSQKQNEILEQRSNVQIRQLGVAKFAF